MDLVTSNDMVKRQGMTSSKTSQVMLKIESRVNLYPKFYNLFSLDNQST
jgi:hypothetical protein